MQKANPWWTCLNINIQSNVCNNSYVSLNNVCLNKVLRWHLDSNIKDLPNYHESKAEKKPWSTNRRNMYLVLLCKLYGCIYFRFELFWNLIYYKCMQQELISSILSKLIWREKYSLETFEICSFKIFDTHWNALTFLLFSKAYTWNFRTLCYWNRWKSIPFWEILKHIECVQLQTTFVRWILYYICTFLLNII